MLDLFLALVWTPLGLGALVAAAAAALAVVYMPRLALPLAAVAGILAGVAYVTRLQSDLASTRRERDDAVELAEVRRQAVSALQRNAAATAKRGAATAAAHDRIQSAPTSDNAALAPVLRDALEAGQ